MSIMYPRVITIVPPQYIPEDEVGDWVSDRAASIINEIGTNALNPKSIALRYDGAGGFILSFDSNYRPKLTPEQRERFDRLEAEYSRPLDGGIQYTYFPNLPPEAGQTDAVDVIEIPEPQADQPLPVDSKKPRKVAKG